MTVLQTVSRFLCIAMTHLHTACLLFLNTVLFVCASASADTLYDKRFNDWQARAETGEAEAQYWLGNAYLRGNEVAIDTKKAVTWFEKAAKTGHPKSQYKLGYVYFTGKGVKKDYEKAYRWLHKSANRDYAPAQFFLAKLYSTGKGTQQDYQKAVFWLDKADEQGYWQAKAELEKVKDEMAENIAQATIKTQAKATKTAATVSKPKAKATPASSEAVTIVAKAETNLKPRNTAKETSAAVEEIFKTKQKLMSGRWLKALKPSETLPSSVNDCVDDGSKLLCRTHLLVRTTPFAEIHYIVDTKIGNFNEKGEFMAQFRTKIDSVILEDPDYANLSEEDAPQVGWKAKTLLKCKFDGVTKIHCVSDDFQKISFRRDY